MEVQTFDIEGLKLLTPKCFGDHRGWFVETYSAQTFLKNGIDITFVQDNHSMSSEKGTLRGLHFQNNDKAQTKLIRCTKGEILDVVVDIRKNSKTYKKWVAVKLTAQNKKQLLIPKGFAHGFLTLVDDCEVQYKVDELYSPQHDRSIRFDDPSINVDWGVDLGTVIISDKDRNAPLLDDSDANF